MYRHSDRGLGSGSRAILRDHSLRLSIGGHTDCRSAVGACVSAASDSRSPSVSKTSNARVYHAGGNRAEFRPAQGEVPAIFRVKRSTYSDRIAYNGRPRSLGMM